MIQFENFSEKAKQVIELIKNCKYKDRPNYNMLMVHYTCSLFNIPQDFNEILEYCKSKNYWLKDK